MLSFCFNSIKLKWWKFVAQLLYTIPSNFGLKRIRNLIQKMKLMNFLSYICENLPDSFLVTMNWMPFEKNISNRFFWNISPDIFRTKNLLINGHKNQFWWQWFLTYCNQIRGDRKKGTFTFKVENKRTTEWLALKRKR